MAVLDGRQVVKVFLTHMDLELADVCLRRCNSKQTLCVQKVRVFTEEASKEPKYHWRASRVGVVR